MFGFQFHFTCTLPKPTWYAPMFDAVHILVVQWVTEVHLSSAALGQVATARSRYGQFLQHQKKEVHLSPYSPAAFVKAGGTCPSCEKPLGSLDFLPVGGCRRKTFVSSTLMSQHL